MSRPYDLELPPVGDMNRFFPNALIIREVLARQNDHGWTVVSFRELAEAVGLSTQGLAHRMHDLYGWGWLEKHPQWTHGQMRPMRLTPRAMQIAGQCVAYMSCFREIRRV